MCGIVGGVSYQEIGEILLQGLKRLEYRGYDSAGLAIVNMHNELQIERVKGKVNQLSHLFDSKPLAGKYGLAHTRWATHGIPSEKNAHPHISHDQIAVVHNGIIENYEELKSQLITHGYQFISDTDSEVIAHLIHCYYQTTLDLFTAVQQATQTLRGMFAVGVVSVMEPNSIIAARIGSPLVIGCGYKENYIASDHFALLAVTNQFIYLEEGTIAKITDKDITVINQVGEILRPEIVTSTLSDEQMGRGKYRHYMEKEIFEQPMAVSATLEARLIDNKVLVESFGINAPPIFDQVENIMIVACGTSYHAGLTARYWLEEIIGLPCQVEIASEYRYRHPIVKPNTLFVSLSQSGETADTIAAFRQAAQQNYIARLAICNVPESSLVREADLVFLTRAGPEIGVASTKSFITQLVSLLMFTVALGQRSNKHKTICAEMVRGLRSLPDQLTTLLETKTVIKELATLFLHTAHALFLGRGCLYPIAMEGALKLKEITYIHAESYPAGELKHGPLAIVDKDMPVIMLAPNNELFEKIKSNLEEVKARGAKLVVLTDKELTVGNEKINILSIPSVQDIFTPFVYTIPLQLLAYYVAVLKGTDVDQPRNLAKSVTVE